MPRRPRHSIVFSRSVPKVIIKKLTKAPKKKAIQEATLKITRPRCRISIEKVSTTREVRDKLVEKHKKGDKAEQQECLKTQPNPIDSLRYEFACKNLTLNSTPIAQETSHKIQFGEYLIDTWFMSPYPPDFYAQSKFFICEFCFAFMKTASMAQRHKEKCSIKCPPGNEIYRQGKISIFEVDGYKNKLYCLNLCLLTKLFLDHKTLFYDVEPFLFYIMTETDQYGCHFMGYFSKEKRSVMNFNVSCILILPTYQKMGYGQYLIDFSYLLTRHENKIGTPEKPLSALGLLGYQRYWNYVVLKYFNSKRSRKHASIDDISKETGMTPDDIIATLERNKILVWKNGRYELHVNKKEIKQQLASIESKIHAEIDRKRLVWTPPSCFDAFS